MRVLAIDPGERVGFAAGDITWDSEGRRQLTLETYGIALLKDFAIKLAAVARDYDVIVYEEYIVQTRVSHAGSTVPTLQLIGMIRLAAWLAAERGEPGPQLVKHQVRQKTTGRAAAPIHLPSAVPIIEDALEQPHDEGHHGDAIMHLVAYFHNNYGEQQ